MSHQLTFAVLSAEQEAARDLRNALAADPRTQLLAACADAEQMYAEVMRLEPAAVVIVLPENSVQELNLIRRLSDARPGLAVVAAARNTALFKNSMRAGAHEFLEIPLSEEEFQTVVGHVGEICAGQMTAQRRRGRVVSIFSSKGGAGVSFVAANLAASMGARTLLVDLNLQAGDADSMLGLEPAYSISSVVKNRARLDDAMLANYLTSYSSSLSLLAAPAEAEEADDISPAHVLELIHILRARFACIVLDLQHTFDAVTVEALTQSDDVLLLMTLDIPGIRSAKRALRLFDRLGYPRQKTHLVINRWSKQVDVALQTVEKHLDERLIGFVPNDYRRVINSINLGQPLVEVEPSSKIALELKRIAGLFAGQTEPPSPPPLPRKGFLRSVFQREAAPGSLNLSTTLDGA